MAPILFNDKLDKQLIKLVKAHPILYQARNNNSSDSAARARVWKAIASKLELNDNTCKTRWRVIRDSYNKNRKKKRSLIQRGVTDFPKSKYDTDNLRFLDQNIKGFITGLSDEILNFSNNEENADEENNHEVLEALDFDAEHRDEYYSSIIDAVNENNDEIASAQRDNSSSLKRTNSFSSNHDEIPKNTIKILSVRGNAVEMVKIDKNTKTYEDCAKKQNLSFSAEKQNLSFSAEKQNLSFSEHPVGIFFESMGRTVMQFPPHLIADARLKVCQIVTEIELKALKE